MSERSAVRAETPARPAVGAPAWGLVCGLFLLCSIAVRIYDAFALPPLRARKARWIAAKLPCCPSSGTLR